MKSICEIHSVAKPTQCVVDDQRPIHFCVPQPQNACEQIVDLYTIQLIGVTQNPFGFQQNCFWNEHNPVFNKSFCSNKLSLIIVRHQPN